MRILWSLAWHLSMVHSRALLLTWASVVLCLLLGSQSTSGGGVDVTGCSTEVHVASLEATHGVIDVPFGVGPTRSIGTPDVDGRHLAVLDADGEGDVTVLVAGDVPFGAGPTRSIGTLHVDGRHLAVLDADGEGDVTVLVAGDGAKLVYPVFSEGADVMHLEGDMHDVTVVQWVDADDDGDEDAFFGGRTAAGRPGRAPEALHLTSRGALQASPSTRISFDHEVTDAAWYDVDHDAISICSRPRGANQMWPATTSRPSWPMLPSGRARVPRTRRACHWSM